MITGGDEADIASVGSCGAETDAVGFDTSFMQKLLWVLTYTVGRPFGPGGMLLVGVEFSYATLGVEKLVKMAIEIWGDKFGWIRRLSEIWGLVVMAIFVSKLWKVAVVVDTTGVKEFASYRICYIVRAVTRSMGYRPSISEIKEELYN